MKTRAILTVVVVAVLLTACVAQQHTKRRQEYMKNHPDITERVKMAIKNGDVLIGMTKEELIASWGQPYDINRTVTATVIREQWVYVFGYVDSYTLQPIPAQLVTPGAPHVYVYLENGIVTSWQD
jgi:hypothetical protein